MKVNSQSTGQTVANLGATKNQKVDGKDAGTDILGGTENVDSSAKVEFSERAQTFGKVKALATPDLDTVREDKVAHFQKMIDEGRYKMDADAIADRMVDEHLIG